MVQRVELVTKTRMKGDETSKSGSSTRVARVRARSKARKYRFSPARGLPFKNPQTYTAKENCVNACRSWCVRNRCPARLILTEEGSKPIVFAECTAWGRLYTLPARKS